MEVPSGRTCTKCGKYKPLDEFNRSRRGTYGRESECRGCKKVRWHENSEQHRQTHRQWHEANREEQLAKMAEYRASHQSELKESRRRFYIENRERLRTERRLWAQENPDRVREWKRNDYQRHTERHREAGRRWTVANRDKANASVRRSYRRDIQYSRSYSIAKNHRRRTLLTGKGSYTPAEWQAMLDWFGGVCLCCGASNVSLTVDHVVPVIHHGPNTIDNLQPLCGSCNSRKGAKTIDYRDPDSLADFLEMLNRRE